VEAGKPFEQIQADDHAVAEMPENLRARSPMMKAVAALLNKGDMAGVFAQLQPVTREVPRDTVPAQAAATWAALPAAERDATLLLSSGRAMRAAANQAAQGELQVMGEIGADAHRFEVLDRVTVTREAARDLRAYREGRVVEVRTDLPSQRLTRGQIGVIVSSEKGIVRLAMRDGSERLFEPGRLPRNLTQDAVSVHAVKTIDVHEGDRIRWSSPDPARDLLNAGLARVEAIREGVMTVSSFADGSVHELRQSDRMLERFDLAYALNAHIAQGVTTPHGIVMMSAGEPKLASAKTLLVAMTRIADQATLIVDSGRNLERAVVRNPGAKTSALDVAKRLPDKHLSLDEPSDGKSRSRDFDMGM
jgi:ATP-dependent exoDNAse (exonuclease V) alpha subunit